MEELAGRQFGPYRVISPLGRGGMAAVYKALQPSVNRHVAVKVLSPHFFAQEGVGSTGESDPEQDARQQFLQRFRLEAAILAQLQHPHILPVFDFGESDGYLFLVMPLIETGTLARLLKGRPLALDVVERVVRQVGEALDYAHSKGVVHRDIKPSNILLDARDNSLLADFGIARMAEGATRLTMTGVMMGTPAYMSPEQAAADPVGPSSDIYSLGIVLYEMLTGRVPYKADTPVAVAIKHITAPLPSPRSVNPLLTSEIESVVVKALARAPQDRFASASAFAAALTSAVRAAIDLQNSATLVTPRAAPAAAKDTMPVPHRQAVSAAQPSWRRAIRLRHVMIVGAALAVLTGLAVLARVLVTPPAGTEARRGATLLQPEIAAPRAGKVPGPPSGRSSPDGGRETSPAERERESTPAARGAADVANADAKTDAPPSTVVDVATLTRPLDADPDWDEFSFVPNTELLAVIRHRSLVTVPLRNLKATPQLLFSWSKDDTLQRLVVSPSGDRVVLFRYSAPQMFALPGGARVARYQGPDTWWNDAAFSGDGKVLVALGTVKATRKNIVVVMDGKTGRTIRQHAFEARSFNELAVRPDGAQLALKPDVNDSEQKDRLTVIDTVSGAIVRVFDPPKAYCVAWTPDGSLFGVSAFSSPNVSEVTFHDSRDWTLVSKLRGSCADDLTFAPDSRVVVLHVSKKRFDDTVEIRAIRDGSLVNAIHRPAYTLQFSADGRYLAVQGQSYEKQPFEVYETASWSPVSSVPWKTR